MDLFVIILYVQCDDYYYGYNKNLLRIYPTFEEAKQYVGTYLLERDDFDGVSGNPYIEIVGMKWGDCKEETLFSSINC